jgi:NADH:ubiquinone oxidoreductase subunit E
MKAIVFLEALRGDVGFGAELLMSVRADFFVSKLVLDRNGRSWVKGIGPSVQNRFAHPRPVHYGLLNLNPKTFKKRSSLLSPLTPAQFAQADAIIAAYRDTQGSLITVLRLCQDIVGYFPLELIGYIASGMNQPLSKVYGVISFYSLFSLKPKGRHNIRVCTGTACYVRGVREVLDRVERRFDVKAGSTCESGRFSLEPVRCLGACGLAPVMVVDQDTHGGVTPDSACEILEGYE